MSTLVWQRLQELAQLLDLDGQAPNALAMADDILRLAREGNDADATALAMIERARVLFLRGERKAAEKDLQKAVRYTAHQGAQHSLSLALSRLAQVFYYMADYYRSLDTWVKCLEASSENGNLRNAIDAYIGVGKVYFAFRDYDLAIHYHELAKSLAADEATHELNAEIHINLAADYFAVGDFDATEHALTLAQTAMAHFSNPTWLGEIQSRYGQINYARADFLGAADYFNQALIIFVEHHSLWGKLTTELNLGRVYINLQRYVEGKVLLNDAAALARQSELPALELEVESLLATLCQETGEYAEALQHHKRFHALAVRTPTQQRRSVLQASANVVMKRLEFPIKALKMRLHYRERRLIASMVNR